MAERRVDQSQSFFVPQDRALIGVVMRQHGREVTRFFADEDEADRALPVQSTDDALSLAGSWSDLSWDETQEELDRIRRETPPSPPIEV